MREDLLSKLEIKVDAALNMIEKLKKEKAELEQENALMQMEQDKWRDDLGTLLKKFDRIEPKAEAGETKVSPTPELIGVGV